MGLALRLRGCCIPLRELLFGEANGNSIPFVYLYTATWTVTPVAITIRASKILLKRPACKSGSFANAMQASFGRFLECVRSSQALPLTKVLIPLRRGVMVSEAYKV